VVVVLEDDASTGPGGPYHRPDDRQWLGHVLEDEAGVHDIEGAPLLAAEGKRHRIARPELDQPLLSGRAGEPGCLGELRGALVDAQDISGGAGCSRHGPTELSQATADIQDSLATAEAKLAQRGLVQQIVQQEETLVLLH
jgi:hypothetical protein